MKIVNVTKKYKTGDFEQVALDSINLDLRKNEFVSILGPSGSGKTTLLNIIGGLDRYDSGDIIIEGKSTKNYNDRDWDTYRNHRIGFVFQSYNLISHLTVLANVELALTIAGVGRAERKKRAIDVLEKVGLGDHLHKKPNQLSGGQMQRVALARALINDPDILLADEPTGALDTDTSIQVMDLLKEVAKERLVIMVTHNPDLAREYSTRIVSLKDGKIVSDTNPYTEEDIEVKNEVEHQRAKMGLLTSLSLSFNNMLTKKGRTFLTAFAGSIGIIGIALILALSNGVNTYISDVQKETMTSYPITIGSEAYDFSSMMGPRNVSAEIKEGRDYSIKDQKVKVGTRALERNKSISISNSKEDMRDFKKYLDDPNSEIASYLGENGVVYSYDINFNVFFYEDDKVFDTNRDPKSATKAKSDMDKEGKRNMSMFFGNSQNKGAENFSQLMKGKGDELVSQVVKDNYRIVEGDWPEKANQVLLVLDEYNTIDADYLYQIGYLTGKEYKDIVDKIEAGEKLEKKVNFKDLLGRKFYLVTAADRYKKQDGNYTYLDNSKIDDDFLKENAIELEVSGIISLNDDKENVSIFTPVVYTSKLTEEIINKSNESAVVVDQLADKDINVLTKVEFKRTEDKDKIEDAKYYLKNLDDSNKGLFYQMIMSWEKDNKDDQTQEAAEDQQTMMPARTGQGKVSEGADLALALDTWIEHSPDDDILLSIYDDYIDGYSYKDNMKTFGGVDYDSPNSINIYTDSFEDKEAVAKSITDFNMEREEKNQIKYVDNVAILIASITSIINVISYVLIAFVAVSLIVSSIMIGIVTHISVMERTKEIGILRSLGASKRNISQVFNAETVIIGVLAGVLGVGIAWLLTFPINNIIQKALKEDAITAYLPLNNALLLVALSMVITVIGGLIPAKKAALKDPVIALRTE